jgi:acyl-CoA reductase-like NAD-dependent aldehyde dehydrogenase
VSERLEVRKTYKMFVGGGFPRSESGRSYPVHDSSGSLLANAVRASRKDVRDAVVAARKAWPKWAAATAYNRGQVLYRVAEMMETRRADLEREVAAAEGKGASSQVDEAIDSFVYYAGWTDKLAQVAGNLNPVAGPYFNLSAPEPMGIVGLVAVEKPSLAHVAARLAAVMCGGNIAVALASEEHPLPLLALCECIATADVPPGVVNVLTGRKDELVPVLAAHLDVDALDVTGVPDELRAEAERLGAENVKRLVAATSLRSPYEVTALMEIKTVWHPKGA